MPERAENGEKTTLSALPNEDAQVRLIPVLDLLNGAVVRAVGGRRCEYRPWTNSLAGSADPLAVAIALFGAFGTRGFYLADLDAIEGRGSNRAAVGKLIAAGFAIWLDGGFERAADFDAWNDAGAARGVFGSETLADWNELRAAVERFGSARVVFSVDCAGGKLLRRAGSEPLAGATDGAACARRAIAAGARTLVLLDLADVGGLGGVSTLELARELRRETKDARVLVGGGVRDMNDLERALAAADGALVATALHAGTIDPEAWRRWRGEKAVL